MATPEFQAISGDGRAEGNALQKVATVMPSYVRSDTDLYSVDCYGLNARDRAHYSSQAMRGRVRLRFNKNSHTLDCPSEVKTDKL